MFMRVFPALLLAGAVSSAQALVVQNGSFETGDFSGWTATPTDGGTAEVKSTTTAGYGAVDGSSYAKLSADAALSQGVSWSAGDTFSFSWNFLSAEMGEFSNNDSSYFQILDDVGSVIYESLLSDVSSLISQGLAATGWQSFSYTFLTGGVGSVQFSVGNAVNTAMDSLLLVDAITGTTAVDPEPPTSVPEPATLALFALGLSGLGLSRRFARRAR